MKNPAASSGVSSVFYSQFTPRGGELYPKERLNTIYIYYKNSIYVRLMYYARIAFVLFIFYIDIL